MVLQCCQSSISISIPKPLLTLTHLQSCQSSISISTTNHRLRKPKPKFSCHLGNIGVDDIAQLAHNKVLVAAAASAVIGQLSKPFTSVLLYGKDFNLKTALQAGGFPSTHSSSVIAAATCLALERGFSDSIFGITLVYAGLVMYDAQGVRREVGNHAKTLNIMLPKRQVNSVVSEDSREETNESAEDFKMLGPILSKKSSSLTSKTADIPLLIASDKETMQTDEAVASLEYHKIPLKESIGHTEVEVVAGALLGFLVSLAVYSLRL